MSVLSGFLCVLALLSVLILFARRVSHRWAIALSAPLGMAVALSWTAARRAEALDSALAVSVIVLAITGAALFFLPRSSQ